MCLQMFPIITGQNLNIKKHQKRLKHRPLSANSRYICIFAGRYNQNRQRVLFSTVFFALLSMSRMSINFY